MSQSSSSSLACHSVAVPSLHRPPEGNADTLGKTPMTTHEALLATARPVYSEGDLVISVGRPAESVFLARVQGHLTLKGARVLGEAIVQAVTSGRTMTHCHDWSAMTDYDSEARVHLTDVGRQVFPKLKFIHLLVTSPLVAFGVRAANLVLRRITVHSSADS